ncbi:hypothetical protein [Paractinoplanes atraurantiacus]|uniref:hypothetical protein n=1 Tax=Paractinoplanes atraurantiacus TaxID=1036182 RepID=UPI001177BC9C|nr:hypothetical protein [Actinoplanes atraurantiacus]
MDQREWDYGARMSRDRRGADSWATRSPDSPDFAEPEAKWSSLTDTGSMQPSAEALDWQRRADAWAQQAESDDSQSVEPANRWSDVASTGRTTFPADGVGWRTETAEWRATGARWKQTTEWRSTTGSHGWRSTTEAWQTGGRSDYPAAAETPTSQPAISSTAWSSGSDDQSADAGARPAWQQFTEPERQEPPSWRDSSTWQQPSPRTPAESSSSWQQLVDPAQPSRPSWQRDAIEGTWNDTGTSTDATWLRSGDDGRHLVREDDRAAWRRGAQQTPGPVGRRRAPEPGPSGGSGWSTGRSEGDSWDTDNWAGHTDTGNIQLYGDPGTSTTSSWRTEEPAGSEPGYRIPPATPYESSRPSRYDDEPRGYAQETPAPRSRRERGPRYADEDTPGLGAAPTSGLVGGATSYPQETRAPQDPWPPQETRAARRARAAQPIDRDRDETSTFGAAPMAYPDQAAGAAPQGGMPTPGLPPQDDPRRGEPRPPSSKARARYNPGSADWREQTASWEAEPDTSSWTRDPDTGQWSRSEDDPRILAWRREAARREAMGEGPRAITAGPAEDVSEQPPAPEPRSRRTPPALPPAPAPRSGTPYGYGAASPTSAVPGRGGYPEEPRRPYDDPPPAPRSAMPYGSAPSTGYPDGPAPTGRAAYPDEPTPRGRAGYDDPAATGRPAYLDEPARNGRAGYQGQPALGGRSSYPEEPTPDGRAAYPEDPAPNGRRPYGDPSSAPRSSTPYGGPSDRGGYPDGPASAPRSSTPYGGPFDRGGYPDGPASAPRSGTSDRGGYPDGPASAPRSATPYGGGQYGSGSAASRSAPPSSAPRSAPSYGAAPAGGYPERYSSANPASGTPRYSASAPASGLPASSQRSLPPAPPRYDSGLGTDSPRYPDSGLGTDSPRYPDGGLTADSPRYPDGGTPRYSTPASGAGLSGDRPRYSPSAPASGLPADTSRVDDLGGQTVRYPADPPRYSASAPSSGLPAIAPRYSSAAPASGLPADAGSPQYGAGAPQYGAGRRRADDQEPPTRRGLLDPTAYAQEPLTPEAWRRDSSPDAPWSPGGTTEIRQRPEPGAWHIAEREERAKGSASYREGGGNDWRRDLAEQSDLAEGESRRYGTSDYVPFRSSGSAAVEGTSNLSMTSTSLISPVPREQREAGGFQGLSGSYERRPVTGGYPTIRKNDLLDPDDEEESEESGGPLAAVGYTLVWYGVPVVLFVVYMVVFGAGSQTHALDTLSKAAPQFGISLVLSVLVAVGLRFISHSWKAISVGLAAAVVGGGLATVLTSAITGNSLS